MARIADSFQLTPRTLVASATLWSGLAAVPAKDTPLASLPGLGGMQVGSAVTTSTAYGGDNAFLFPDAPAGRYVVAIAYGGHVTYRAFDAAPMADTAETVSSRWTFATGIAYADGSVQTTATTPSSGGTNAGDVNIAADTDASGGGVINFATKAVSRGRITNDGFAELAIRDTGGQVVNVKAAPYSAVGDGVTTDTTAFQAAIDACAALTNDGTVFVPPGIYVSGQLTRRQGVRLLGAGINRTVLQFTDVAGEAVVSDFNNPAGNIALTANVAVGDDTFLLASTTGLAVGQDVMFKDDATAEGAGVGTVYHGMFISRIKAIVANTSFTTEEASPVVLTTVKNVKAYYFSTAAGLERGAAVSDMTLRTTTGAVPTNRTYLLSMTRLCGGTVERVRFSGAKNGAMRFTDCLGSRLRDCEIEHIGAAGTGVEILTSVGTDVAGTTVRDAPFGITATSSPFTNIHHNDLSGRSGAANGRGAKAQAGSYFSRIHDNLIRDYYLMGPSLFDSPYSSIKRNTVFRCGGSTSDFGAEVGGYTTAVQGCVVEENVVSHSAGTGIIYTCGTIGATLKGGRIVNNQIIKVRNAISAQVSGLTITDNDLDDFTQFFVGIGVGASVGACVVERNRGNNSAGTFISTSGGTGGNKVRHNVATDTITPGFPPGYSVHATDVFEPSEKIAALTYSATIATNAALGDLFTIVATNGTAFTISNPTNPTSGRKITYDIKNSSGGVMGAVTFGAAFLLAGAFTGPASTKRRLYTFYYDGTNWVEAARSPADI